MGQEDGSPLCLMPPPPPRSTMPCSITSFQRNHHDPTPPSSAPGPDIIPYSVWKSLHRIAPDILTALLSPLLLFGHHPSSIKMANGVVLDNPGKPSYDSPSAFHIIVLLPTISKILERIVASRFSAIARYIGLLHRNQCGSLPSLTSFDACTALADTVRTLQRPALKVSSLFLDIKGGFDNVDADILCSSLRSKGVNHYLVSWVRSFLTGRSCRLLFQGAPRIFSLVSVGTPQGSPVSPLLFVIYVASLHISLDRGLVLSYVDDFSLTVSSPSYRTNSRALQAAFGRIRAIPHSRKVDFSVPKTELIHWRTPMERDPPGTPRPPPVALDGQIFHPCEKLRWLGYWFVPSLASSAHFSQLLALSPAAFSSVRRLSDAGKGVSPNLCNGLFYCLMFPSPSYGADLFTPTKGLQQDGGPLAARAEIGHQLLPVQSRADPRCGIVSTTTHGPSPTQKTDGCYQAHLLPDVYQPRLGPPLQVFPYSTQGQGSGLPSGPVHTPGSQCHAT